MPKAKYFDKVRAAQEKQQSSAPDLTPFDLAELAPSSWIARQASKFTRKAIRPLYSFSRQFRPVMSLGGLIHITRDEQVRQILHRPDDFIVPFGPEMKELGDGATFLLGLEGPEHDRYHRIIAEAIRPEDLARIGAMSSDFAGALLANHNGSIDVVANLIKRVPTEICLRYFGLSHDDPDLFGDWTLAISAFLFGDPFADDDVRRLAVKAARKLGAVIDQSIQLNKRLARDFPDIAEAETLVHRLLIIQSRDPEALTDKEVRAILIGLIAGFIPTNTLAASNMVEVILTQPQALKMAKHAAVNADRAMMQKIVYEAGRLNPALAPGQWRYCPEETTIDVGGVDKKIAKGTTLLVSTMSAMRDPRVWDNPSDFRIDRTVDGAWQEPDLIFGLGRHICMGKHLALEQITSLFMQLFALKNIRPASGKAGKLSYLGLFPRHLQVEYDTPCSRQSMFMVVAPIIHGASQAEVDAKIAELGHPALPEVRDAFDATGLVHFASLATLEADDKLFLAFELSCDGSPREALTAIGKYADAPLRDIFAYTDWDTGTSLGLYLNNHIVKLHGKMWGATGLNYNGLAEFPVSKKLSQAKFADFSARVMRDFVASETARGSHPMLPMLHFRRILRQDPLLKADATPAQIDLMEEAKREKFDAFHLSTQDMRLALSRFREPTSHLQGALRFFASRDATIVSIPLVLLMTVLVWFLWPTYVDFDQAKAALSDIGGNLANAEILAAIGNITEALSSGLIKWLMIFLMVLIGALIAAAGVLAILGALFIAAIRRTEKAELPSNEPAPLEHMHSLMQADDAPGYAQNHVFATAYLKPGLFRQFLHAFALWANRVIITYWFRPGFVLSMGTIHYARWWRLPGTRRAVFYSNFDGSWENYLEDFITRARWGQSAAWSNWEGFPKTEYLAWKGAEDSDAFKRYTRSVQRVAPFWYSRFPELTSEQIRNNGLIHVGTSLARSSTEAEQWLSCFSSMPKHINQVELDEVQALVLRGMKRLPHSACLTIKLPDESADLGSWLCWIRGKPMRIEGLVPQHEKAQINALVEENILEKFARPLGRPDEYALPQSLSIAFGDRPLVGKGVGDQDDAQRAMAQAVFLGFSAAGLAKFTPPGAPDNAINAGMPPSFQMGMRARSKILGDPEPGQPEGDWRWNDNSADSGDERTVEAVLTLYAADPKSLDQMVMVHTALLENHGGHVITQIDCAPAIHHSGQIDFEHFGFRDGISQPVLKGTGRSTKDVPARDLIEPGEFIIGYQNESGYFPVSPKLPPEADLTDALPVAIGDNLSRFPDFGDVSLAGAERDFGRNGTFLVLRELQQDVKGFDDYAHKAAEELNKDGFKDLYRVVGQRPDAAWVKAKMMGRWQDGRPLIGNPVGKVPGGNTYRSERENDFSFGGDDPQGIACPYAAHIRRTNPRDSKQPGDEDEQAITNRHRLLRRGRPYTNAKTGEKGLLFACICTDIERQFEFVQQFWSNAPSFHGLDNEPDPIIGSDSVSTTDGKRRERHFSIPTAVGPIRLEGLQSYVKTMGGGYFFMPGRSTLSWLSETASYQRDQPGLTDRDRDGHQT